MRIRSVLAATALAAALAASGATTASAAHYDTKTDDEAVCSPYAGTLTSLENHLTWSGAHCSDYLR
ncbi:MULTISPECIES: hypothetical protein [Streptomyces]|uniref:Uncharacterized protein n=2 Tax=Streptomyces TaxID=1883 RepID=A0A117QFS4_STRCK|nr:hypothetical protein [Streptomyces corchorusii]AEY89030.1 hypothetical protein SHJG_3758 [Streptomyces hygroscopicus subsp. jinggangensis 5008]AGF63188.1 hypothetical protein SHJGH_3523 [Streptomyces hygroscopicus subsp. jinggangensis TL01]ALO93466.1 hypothetical protein SHL15_2310 [Streptomyces hygroscopicus subsp. limoneus]KUN25963.1 hypothetical protein AQJ11_18575 [Streptomyces corchorusii]